MIFQFRRKFKDQRFERHHQKDNYSFFQQHVNCDRHDFASHEVCAILKNKTFLKRHFKAQLIKFNL